MKATNLTLKQGDTNLLEALITRRDDAGVEHAVDLSPPGTQLIFTVKQKMSDPDSAAFVQKGTASASLTGVVFQDAANGEALITLDPEDTEDAGDGTQFYYWDLELIESDGTVTTVAAGRMALTEEITLVS